MDVFEAVDTRISCRWFLDKPVDPKIVKDLIVRAQRAAAGGYGLDTCPQEAWAPLYKVVGAFVKIPPEQMLFCGMAIGYGDHSHPANSFRSPRAELDEFCWFYGFD